MTKVKVNGYKCDNPSCDTFTIEDAGNPTGYLFDTIRYDYSAGGGAISDIYACSDDCVLLALEHKIAEARRA